MNLLVSGATGLIGRGLCRSVSGRGHTVIALSRSPQKAGDLAADEVLAWDATAEPPPREATERADVAIHLVGEPIADHRWTEEQKRRIRDSRVISTRNLVDGFRTAKKRPSALICSSAVGYYGDRGNEELHERSGAGRGFLSEVCEAWEAEAERASELSIRVVQVRTGVVLSPAGGALKRMLTPFKMCVGGPIGGGRQWFPWIHIDDIVGIFVHAAFSDTLKGPLNGAAPEAVTNAAFASELGRVLNRPALLPMPEFALRLLMGEMAAIVLASQRVVPSAALESGYSFEHPSLLPALEDLLKE